MPSTVGEAYAVQDSLFSRAHVRNILSSRARAHVRRPVQIPRDQLPARPGGAGCGVRRPPRVTLQNVLHILVDGSSTLRCIAEMGSKAGCRRVSAWLCLLQVRSAVPVPAWG